MYGPSDDPGGPVEVVETYGELSLEYAAIRKRCALFDQPHRAIIAISGRDRIDFLNRMVTQELKGMAPFRVRRSFWLNGKGRIDADLRIIDLPTRTLLDLDVHAVERTIISLAKYVVTEDVTIENWTGSTHRILLMGPKAMDLVASAAQSTQGADASGPSFADLHRERACVVRLFGAETVIYREDQCGEPGLELIVPSKHALNVYQSLIAHGHDSTHDMLGSTGGGLPRPSRDLAARVGLRPVGWHAFNIARIEAGTPVYNLDFGPNSLPAETGVLDDRVSFKKGCYLGQEIVARMQARGHPKHMLVAVKFESKLDSPSELPMLPVTGAALTLSGGDQVVGQVTSSTLSPVLSSVPIAFAQVKFAHIQAGTILTTVVEGITIQGVVQASLGFALTHAARPAE